MPADSSAVFLTARASVFSAPRGLYVVKSGTPAFFPAQALISLGRASFVGEFYDRRDRRRVVTFRIDRAGQRVGGLGDAEIRRTISVGREFFVSAVRDYHDWPLKWWREAVQNSVDAGATQVDLAVEERADGTAVVSTSDNGSGMDEATILDKFLVLGATTKVGGAGTAGGFGKAKELLLLPWLQWRVHSRDTVVQGSGIDYTVQRGPVRQGTVLEVVMPPDMKTAAASAIALIERSHLPRVTFTVNGERHRAALRGKDLVETVEGKAEVYFTPTPKEQHYAIIVRARGLYMFEEYVSAVPGRILVELTAPSIEILSANRDGFRDSQVRGQISRLGARIAKDNLSALKAKAGLIRKKYIGSGKFRAEQRESAVLSQVTTATERVSAAEISNIVEALKITEPTGGGTLATAQSDSAKLMLEIRFTGPAHIEAALKQLVWEPDFYVVNEIEGFRVPKKFMPETMTPTVLKLAKTWVELCRFVLIQLGSMRRFGVGWMFSDSAKAAALSEETHEQWLLLNPFRDIDKRDEILHPAQDADLKWLYAAAIHEATHIADGIDYHDESFAAALTQNVARTADGYRKIRQIVAGIRMAGGPEADE